MSDPTAAQLDQLLALQDTDTAIRRLRHQLDSLDEQQQLDAAEQRRATLRDHHDATRLDLDTAAAEQRQLEREIDVLSQRRDAEKSKLYDGTVTNQREMQSVEAEIETTVRRLDEHEELLYGVLERVEQLEAQQAALAEEIVAEDARIVELAAARDAAATAILAELAELEVGRDAQAAELPDDLLARYDAVVKRTGGVAIGRLEGQACTACRVELSMADVNELLAGPTLTTCPQCRRLLVIPD
ncbi:MAG: C4-type zinc ribbon domain-containing protein [Nitriliruptoraceae bacterium]